MNNLTLARAAKRAEGNSSTQTIPPIGKKGLITQIIIANNHGTLPHDVKILLNGTPLFVVLVNGSSTFIQDLAVPIEPDDALTFNTAANVYLTVVYALTG
jgi:hypothetical protein